MADFQNGLISRIFRVFCSGFFAQNNSNVPVGSFFARFWPFEILSQTDHLAKSIPFARWQIFKMVSLLDYRVFFFQRFFAKNNSNGLVESFFARFWPFEFLSQTDHFAKSIAFGRWPIFKMISFLECLVFFLAVFFPQNNSNVLVESFFARFWPFEFLSQTDHVAKSIGFPRWPIFKMVSFLEYLCFSSGFLHRTTLTCS